MSARFDLRSQSGETINNVGGDQHVHLTRNGRRLAAAGKAIALLGFALSLAALVGIGSPPTRPRSPSSTRGPTSRARTRTTRRLGGRWRSPG